MILHVVSKAIYSTTSLARLLHFPPTLKGKIPLFSAFEVGLVKSIFDNLIVEFSSGLCLFREDKVLMELHTPQESTQVPEVS